MNPFHKKVLQKVAPKNENMEKIKVAFKKMSFLFISQTMNEAFPTFEIEIGIW